MLIGKKIILESIEPESIEQLRLWRNQVDLRRYFREYREISRPMQEKWYNERGNNSDIRHAYFQIMAKENSYCNEDQAILNRKLIGCCGVLNIDWRLRSGELSIFIDPKMHGRGFGKETLEMLMKYAFSEINLHKFWGECYNSNDAISLYRKVGFKDDAVLRDNWYHDGAYGNSYVFSILKKEWEEKYFK